MEKKENSLIIFEWEKENNLNVKGRNYCDRATLCSISSNDFYFPVIFQPFVDWPTIRRPSETKELCRAMANAKCLSHS